MPKEYFSPSGAASLDVVPSGGKIHVVGVCGVAMAQLAVLLARRGYIVTGSDREFYEPMSSFLSTSSVVCFRGYASENVPKDVSLVVIGNSISYGNPEVEEVEHRHLPYTLFPKLLHETVIAGTEAICVAGTHGKSTTTSILATALMKLGVEPGYFIGARVSELPTSLEAGAGRYSVVEGDEYDSAFFAKVPKFSFYQPTILIVTSIEFDHADIYPDLSAIKGQFSALVASLSSRARVVCCIDDVTVRELVPEWRDRLGKRLITYGTSNDADVRITRSSQEDSGAQKVCLSSELGGSGSFLVPLAGLFSARNATAVHTVLRLLGFSPEDLGGSIASFKGLSRRQEVRFDREVTLVEDFAHHPTAVRETIAGMKERYAGRRLWAVFEPRSNTSRRRVFQEPYVEAFRSADEVILCEVVARHNDEGVAMLSVGVLAEQIAASGIHAVVLPDAERIREHLLAQIREGDVILLMSNGSFGGLPAALEEALRLRFPNGGTVAGQNSSSSGGCRLGAGGGAGFGSD